MKTSRFIFLTLFIVSLMTFSCGRNQDPGDPYNAVLAPFDVVADEGNEKIEVSWKSNQDHVSYKIYYGNESKEYDGKDAENGSSPISVGKGIKSITLTGLENGKEYFIVVTAIYEDKESSYSTEVIAIPEDPDNPNPQIQLSKISYHFYCDAGGSASDNLTISNSGGGDMEWTSDESAAWLSLSPDSGTNFTNVTLTANCSGLSNGYENTVNVNFHAAGAISRSLEATVHVSDPSTPNLAVSGNISATCTEGDSESLKGNFTVSNSGNGDQISFTTSEGASWLRLSPTSGTTGTASATVSVYVDCTNLSQGSTSEQISVIGNSETEHVTVSLTISGEDDPPNLDISKHTVNVTCNAGDSLATLDSINVTNSGGGGSIAFTTEENVSWLALTPISGNTDRNVDIRIDCSSLSIGSNPSTDIDFKYDTQTETATVNLTVADGSDGPQISFSPASGISTSCVQGSSTSSSFTVVNDGDAELSWNASESAGWLNLTPSSGTVSAGGSSTVAVGIDCNGLGIGDHSESVTVSNNAGGDKYYSIAVNVTPGVITGLNAIGGDHVINVSWEAVVGATQYILYYSQDTFDEGDLAEPWVQHVTIDTNSYSITMDPGRRRYIRVKISEPEESALSNMVDAISIPNTIWSFDLMADQVSFTAEFDGIEGTEYYNLEYRIEGSEFFDSQNFTHVGEHWATQTLTVNTDIVSGSTYEVQISACNESGCGPASSIQSILIPTVELLAPEPYTKSQVNTPQSGGAVRCVFTWTWSPLNIDMSNVIGFRFYYEINNDGIDRTKDLDRTEFSTTTSFYTKAGNIDRMTTYVRAIYTGNLPGEATHSITGTCSDF